MEHLHSVIERWWYELKAGLQLVMRLTRCGEMNYLCHCETKRTLKPDLSWAFKSGLFLWYHHLESRILQYGWRKSILSCPCVSTLGPYQITGPAGTRIKLCVNTSPTPAAASAPKCQRWQGAKKTAKKDVKWRNWIISITSFKWERVRTWLMTESQSQPNTPNVIY